MIKVYGTSFCQLEVYQNVGTTFTFWYKWRHTHVSIERKRLLPTYYLLTIPGPCKVGTKLLADLGTLAAEISDVGETIGVVGVAGGKTGMLWLVGSSANKVYTCTWLSLKFTFTMFIQTMIFHLHLAEAEMLVWDRRTSTNFSTLPKHCWLSFKHFLVLSVNTVRDENIN